MEMAAMKLCMLCNGTFDIEKHSVRTNVKAKRTTYRWPGVKIVIDSEHMPVLIVEGVTHRALWPLRYTWFNNVLTVVTDKGPLELSTARMEEQKMDPEHVEHWRCLRCGTLYDTKKEALECQNG